MKGPFWEESYMNDDFPTFGVKPDEFIVKYKDLYNKEWNILDVGCGDGKNSIYFARRGFKNIDAFDLSENAILKMNRLLDVKKLKVNTFVGDLTEFEFEKKYDFVMSFGTLHFVSKEKWKKFIWDAKENTNSGGMHIIQIFTNKVPASPDISDFAVGLADEEELKEMYEDWEILDFKSFVFEDEHHGVPKHYHASNKIVARKV